MGMYFLEIVPVQNLDSTFAYGISVMASSDGSITSNEVFQFTLNDIFTNVTLDAPEKTKANYENNIVTWEVGTLDTLSKDTPLVLNINVEHPTELQEGTLIASAVTNTFLNEQGEEMIEDYDDFNFGPPASPSLDLDIDVIPRGDCLYQLNYKATNKTRNRLTDVSFSYVLGADFEWVTLPLTPFPGIPVSTETTWHVGTLNSDQHKSATATIRFIGNNTVGPKTIFADIMAASTPPATFTGTKTLSTNVDKVCKAPCCEPCPREVPVNFDSCEQSETANVTAEILSDGREIKVKVTITAACRRKRVVVGLELFEKTTPTTSVRRALKVLDLAALTTGSDTCEKRECDCATFFIPGPICPEQHFFIKAQAHYFDTPPSTCNCTCVATNGIQE